MEPPARPSSAPRAALRHAGTHRPKQTGMAPMRWGSWGLTLLTVMHPLPTGLSPLPLCHCPSSRSGDISWGRRA